jgi:hypothetical protein
LRAMRVARISLALLVLATLAGCVSVRFGRDFPSPEEGWIVRGKTDRYGLVRMFGEPVQMGFDNGDPTWRWFFGQRDSTAEISKDLTVRFGSDSVVKSYSFISSFPDDLRRLDDPRRVR